MCGLAAEVDAIGAQFGLTTRDWCLPETLPHKTGHNRGLRQTHAAPPTSAPRRASHVGKQRAVTGVGTIGEQVASERATCRGYCILLYCFAAILFIITLQICYVWIFEYLGGPTFKEGGPTLESGGPIFRREDSRKYAHPPL